MNDERYMLDIGVRGIRKRVAEIFGWDLILYKPIFVLRQNTDKFFPASGGERTVRVGELPGREDNGVPVPRKGSK
ncbi:MAG: hypothetical protein ACR2KT_12190 [Methylocella sp.]|nr:MAG: hypothetical protein DLM68_02265 [Hyphomicrobiales bacterium]